LSDWTLQRIEQLAPDAAAIKAAQGVAAPSKWQNLGRSDRLIWGECQGSGSNPYQVRVDLLDVAYKCSCPSRKLPCKHTLGLLMLMAKGTDFATGAPPAFVDEWAANRAKRAETKVAKSEPATAEELEAQAKRAEKRQEKRESRVEGGLAQLESWLADLLTQGLAAARTQPPAFWTQMSARLVDAQAPGLARRVRELESAALASADWQERLLAGLARLQLIVDAYRRIDALQESLAAELRSTIGWTQNQDALRERDGLRDHWQVVGYRATEVEQLRVQSTWLLGQASKRIALLLDFAAGNQPLTASFVTGQVLDATVVWFDGEPPLRAILRERHGPGKAALDLSHFAALPTGVQAEYAAQLARCPWLERWPLVLGPVHAVMRDGQCRLVDGTGCSLRLPTAFRHGWALRALSTRGPLHLFGEWDGQVFDPVTVSCAGEWFSLATLGELAVLAKVA
jgi:hypothetical protein